MRVAISVSIGLAFGALAIPADARQAPGAARTILADLRQEAGDASTRLIISGSARSSVTHHSPDPLTLVVDIADADSSRLPARLEVATREIESLRVSSLARGDGRTTARVEVRLATLAPFTVEDIGNDVIITVSRAQTSRGNASPAEVKPVPAGTAPSLNGVPLRVAAPATEAEPAPRATRISGVSSLGGGQVGYHIEGNGALHPESFFLKNPNRIVIDFPDVVAARPQSLPAAKGPVKAMRLAQFSSAPPRVARLVLEVDTSMPYELVPDATGVSIVFGTGAPAAPSLLGAPPATLETANPVVQQEPVLNPSPSPAQPASPAPEIGAPVATAPVPAVSAPPPAAAPIVPAPAPMKPRIQPEPITKVPAQSPAAETSEGMASAGGPSKTFTGHPISLDFKEGDIIDLFRLMSEISGLNIIVNPGITGKTSLTVKEVPWDQALDIILKTQGLGYSVDGNVVRIARLADLQAEEVAIRNLKKEKELSGDMESWQGRLSYLDGELVKGIVEKTVLSAKGTFTPAGSNVFIVNDLPEYVTKAKRLILELDRPSAQVEIEARIVVTSRNFSRQLGVQWGFLNQQTAQFGNTTNLTFPNAIILNGQATPSSGGFPADQGALASDAGIGIADRGYMVNLPAASVNSGIGISMGNILGSFNLDAALTAAESTGRARIISTPRITTQNKVAASIKQGVQIPYQTVTNGTVNVSYKDAGLSMAVTPTITEAGTVLMQVTVENSSPDFARSTLAGVPINTQSAQTSVLVRDGATTVIGGVYLGQETITKQNTPLLSQIPVLGLLFKNKAVQNSNDELLIFITPRIVR